MLPRNEEAAIKTLVQFVPAHWFRKQDERGRKAEVQVVTYFKEDSDNTEGMPAVQKNASGEVFIPKPQKTEQPSKTLIITLEGSPSPTTLTNTRKILVTEMLANQAEKNMLFPNTRCLWTLLV